MIIVLAGSENDAALIARAAGTAARVVTDAVQFTNGDGPVECLILGCRHPIPAETIELLRDIERKRLWIPLILVTDREPEAVRRLSDVKTSAVVWFADLHTELPLEIEAARGSVPLLRLAEQAGEATLPPALRTALPCGGRSGLAGRDAQGGRTTLSQYLVYSGFGTRRRRQGPAAAWVDTRFYPGGRVAAVFRPLLRYRQSSRLGHPPPFQGGLPGSIAADCRGAGVSARTQEVRRTRTIALVVRFGRPVAGVLGGDAQWGHCDRNAGGRIPWDSGGTSRRGPQRGDTPGGLCDAGAPEKG